LQPALRKDDNTTPRAMVDDYQSIRQHSTPKRSGKRRLRSWLLALGAGLLIGACLAYQFLPALSLRRISLETGLSFPPGSRLLHYWRDGWWMGVAIDAKIELPPDKVQEFFDSLPCPHQLSSGTHPGTYQGDLDPTWWDPLTSRHFLATECVQDASERTGQPGTNTTAGILVAYDKGPRPVLYLHFDAD
jgi:hypothetical protein